MYFMHTVDLNILLIFIFLRRRNYIVLCIRVPCPYYSHITIYRMKYLNIRFLRTLRTLY